jgi:hypothetical protein
MQIVLAGALPVAALARTIGLSTWLAGLLALAFGGTSAPLLRRAARTDPALLPWVVLLRFLRAFAQGLGLAHGLASMPSAHGGKHRRRGALRDERRKGVFTACVLNSRCAAKPKRPHVESRGGTGTGNDGGAGRNDPGQTAGRPRWRRRRARTGTVVDGIYKRPSWPVTTRLLLAKGA